MGVDDPKLYRVVAPDAGLWRLTRAYLGACQNQVGDIGDDQCFWLGAGENSRVVAREKVEGGIGGDGDSCIEQVFKEGVAGAALPAGLSRCGVDVVFPAVLFRGASGSCTAAADEQHHSKFKS